MSIYNLKLVRELLAKAIRSGVKFERIGAPRSYPQNSIWSTDGEIQLVVDGHTLDYNVWTFCEKQDGETLNLDGEPLQAEDLTRSLIGKVGIYTDAELEKRLLAQKGATP